MKIYQSVWILILLIASYTFSSGQNPAVSSSGSANVINVFGKITSIDTPNKKINIQTSAGGNLTIFVNEKTVFKQVASGETTLKSAVTTSFDKLSVNDQIYIRGQSLENSDNVVVRQIVLMTQSDILQRQKQRLEEWKQRGISGAIIKTDPEQRKISVQLRGQTQPTEVFIAEDVVVQRYKPNAVNLNDFAPSQFAELKAGEQVRILNRKDTVAVPIDAEEIFVGNFNTRFGKVVSVNSEKNEFKIMDALNKTVVVTVNSESNMWQIPQDLLKAENLKTNESEGKINLTNLLGNATKIKISDVKLGESIAIASSSDSKQEHIVGLIVVTGIDSLKSQSAKKSAAPVKSFNLDVF